jgi:pantothenate kinase
MSTKVEVVTVEELAGELAAHAAGGDARVMVGVCGAPGAGKSTLAEGIAGILGPGVAVVVPFDGFHLATDVIRGTPLAERRGAIDTFDLGAYRALLERLRAREDEVVYAPVFRRGLEEPIASAIPVPRDLPVVLTEGNYLLDGHPEMRRARRTLDAVWYLDTPDDVRVPRLVARHIEFGRAPADADAWARGTDQVNADRVAANRTTADRVLRLRGA